MRPTDLVLMRLCIACIYIALLFLLFLAFLVFLLFLVFYDWSDLRLPEYFSQSHSVTAGGKPSSSLSFLLGAFCVMAVIQNGFLYLEERFLFL